MLLRLSTWQLAQAAPPLGQDAAGAAPPAGKDTAMAAAELEAGKSPASDGATPIVVDGAPSSADAAPEAAAPPITCRPDQFKCNEASLCEPKSWGFEQGAAGWNQVAYNARIGYDRFRSGAASLAFEVFPGFERAVQHVSLRFFGPVDALCGSVRGAKSCGLQPHVTCCALYLRGWWLGAFWSGSGGSSLGTLSLGI